MPVVLIRGEGVWHLLVFGDDVELWKVLKVIDGCDMRRVVIHTDRRNRDLGKRLEWALCSRVFIRAGLPWR